LCCSLEPRGDQRRTFRRHLPELRLFSPEVHSAMESVSHRGTVSSTWAGARLSRSGHRRILPSLTSGPLPDAQDFLLCSAILRTEEETWRFVAVQSPDTRPDQLRFARHLTGKPSQHQIDDKLPPHVGATNVFAEAWRAPHGPMLGPATACRPHSAGLVSSAGGLAE